MAHVEALPVMALVTGIADYQVRVLRGVATRLDRRGVPLLVVANEPIASDRTPSLVLDLVRHRRVRGVIALADAAPFPQPELPEALLAAGVPTVTLGQRLAGAPVVLGDNTGGMVGLMRHLLDDCRVRRPVLLLGIPGHVDSVQREAAFRQEMARRDLPVDEELAIVGGFRPTESYDALNALLTRRRDIDAVVALNDMSAFGALSALTDHGLRVPQDVLLSGFDNTEAAVTSWPPLTSVDPGLEEQGGRAVDLVLQLADGLPCPPQVTIPSRLVVRASTRVRGEAAGDQDHTCVLRALQNQVALQDAAAYLSSSLANCRTLPDVLAAVEPRLRRLGLRRCFLGIDRPRPAVEGARDVDVRCSLVLSYRDGAVEPLPDEVFPRHRLLPSWLRHELRHGTLLLQALSIGGRERGYLLFEPVQHSYLLTEALRLDLPRTVDFVLSWQEMRDHSDMLEQLVVRRTWELEQANTELKRAMLLDGLTGAANRLAFQQHLRACWEDGGAEGRQLSIVMVDVDLFKDFNDRYGHLAGDDALRTVAACLVQSAREPGDLACRYGGEEFAVVLRDASAEAALAVARRFRILLDRAAIPHERSPIAPVVTASVGVASGVIRSEADITRVVDAADQALYQAKAQGRNRTVLAGADGAVPAQVRRSRRPAPAGDCPGAAATVTRSVPGGG